MDYCVDDIFVVYIIHVTVQCLASGECVHQHWQRHWGHLLCCRMACWPLFVCLHTTANEWLAKQVICWIYHICHCTVFGIIKICSAASAAASGTYMVLPNSMLTPFVGLNTTTNELLFEHIYWICHAGHCTVFSIGKICLFPLALASVTPSVLLNVMLTPDCWPEYSNKWILV